MAEDAPSVGAFAIVPSNDLAAAIPFWERLGMTRVNDFFDYVIMQCRGREVDAGGMAFGVGDQNRVKVP